MEGPDSEEKMANPEDDGLYKVAQRQVAALDAVVLRQVSLNIENQSGFPMAQVKSKIGDGTRATRDINEIPPGENALVNVSQDSELDDVCYTTAFKIGNTHLCVCIAWTTDKAGADIQCGFSGSADLDPQNIPRKNTAGVNGKNLKFLVEIQEGWVGSNIILTVKPE